MSYYNRKKLYNNNKINNRNNIEIIKYLKK